MTILEFYTTSTGLLHICSLLYNHTICPIFSYTHTSILYWSSTPNNLYSYYYILLDFYTTIYSILPTM